MRPALGEYLPLGGGECDLAQGEFQGGLVLSALAGAECLPLVMGVCDLLWVGSAICLGWGRVLTSSDG